MFIKKLTASFLMTAGLIGLMPSKLFGEQLSFRAKSFYLVLLEADAKRYNQRMNALSELSKTAPYITTNQEEICKKDARDYRAIGEEVQNLALPVLPYSLKDAKRLFTRFSEEQVIQDNCQIAPSVPGDVYDRSADMVAQLMDNAALIADYDSRSQNRKTDALSHRLCEGAVKAYQEAWETLQSEGFPPPKDSVYRRLYEGEERDAPLCPAPKKAKAKGRVPK